MCSLTEETAESSFEKRPHASFLEQPVDTERRFACLCRRNFHHLLHKLQEQFNSKLEHVARLFGCGYLERLVQVFPTPVALDDLKHSGSRRQKLGVGQIGGVHRDEDTRAGNDLQLLMKGRGCIELNHSYLQNRKKKSLLLGRIKEAPWT